MTRDGNLISASNDAGTYSMSYNGHELVSESGPYGVTLTYGYDSAGHVNSIVDSQGGTTSLTYGANGEVLTETYQDTSNHFRVNYTYDQDGQCPDRDALQRPGGDHRGGVYANRL